MASESNPTIDHDAIRRRVEEHDGKPARDTEPEGGEDRTRLKPISRNGS